MIDRQSLCDIVTIGYNYCEQYMWHRQNKLIRDNKGAIIIKKSKSSQFKFS